MHVVVEEALRDVEDPFPRDVDRLERELEPGRRRLVAPRHLRGDDPIEGQSELLVRHREEIGVAVRDHAEPVTLVQTAERLGAVREDGPVAHALGEPRDDLVVHLEAEVRGDAADAVASTSR